MNITVNREFSKSNKTPKGVKSQIFGSSKPTTGEWPSDSVYGPLGDTTMSGAETTLDSTVLQPVVRTGEFLPLSVRPILPGQTIESNSLADKFVLEKQTPIPPGQESAAVQKDLDTLVPETEKMIKSEFHQAKHSRAMSSELKLLLENEKKILDQIMRRCNAFTQLKEENKQTTEEWNVENKKRLLKCEKNILKLSNYPDYPDLVVDVEGLHGQVQQKILLELVHKTAEAATDINLQLSIENTILNDVDLSLSGLKKHSAMMLRNISGWTKMLTSHEEHQDMIVDRWEEIKKSLKELRKKAKELLEARVEEGQVSNKEIVSVISAYGERIRKLEKAFKELTQK